MANLRLERTLSYSPEQLWEMVGDVERYPDFIPWISRLHTYNRKDDSFDADVSVGFKMLSEKFTTRVVRNAAARTVDFRLIRGPFRKLNGQWRFAPAADGTRITFDMDIDIKNPFLDALFRANFDRAVSKLMAIFEQRAAALYAEPR